MRKLYTVEKVSAWWSRNPWNDFKNMWQSRVEIGGYSIAYFDCITAFEAPYRWTSVTNEAHTCDIVSLDTHTSSKHWVMSDPMSTALTTVAFLLLLDTSLLSQAGIMHYSQQLTLQHSTKVLFFFFLIFLVDLGLSSKFRPSHKGFYQTTS